MFDLKKTKILLKNFHVAIICFNVKLIQPKVLLWKNTSKCKHLIAHAMQKTGLGGSTTVRLQQQLRLYLNNHAYE